MLSSRLLVAFTAEFGVSEGATRVALSRMIDRGELSNTDGRYALEGALLDRQRRQEAGLAPDPRPWTGEWEMVVIRPGPRAGADRAALRVALAHLNLGERREGTWLRPDNLDPQRLPPDREVVADQADRFTATSATDPRRLAGELFDLDSWHHGAERLRARMADLQGPLDACEQSTLAPGFDLAAAVLRHLVADPLLPQEIEPAGWPARALRTEYAAYDRAYRSVLASFFGRV